MPDSALLQRWHESGECRAACADAYAAYAAVYSAARDKWMAEHEEDDAACEVPSGEGGEEDA